MVYTPSWIGQGTLKIPSPTPGTELFSPKIPHAGDFPFHIFIQNCDPKPQDPHTLAEILKNN
jgi:hypothetical protein